MSIDSTTLNVDEIRRIAERDDFHVAPLRGDGKTLGTPTWIWVVAVGDKLFVRAYHGTKSSWFKSAISQGAGQIQAAGLVKNVRFKQVTGSIGDEIDAAYRDKYSGSPYLSAMISDRAKAATVQILPGA